MNSIFQQRVGPWGKLTYTLNLNDTVISSFKSPTKSWERAIDLKLLNPNPIREKMFSFRPFLLGTLFLVLGFVWLGGGIANAPTIGGKIGFSFIGLLCLVVCVNVFWLGYLRSREIKAFINILTGRAEIVLYISSKTSKQVDEFVQQVSNQILHSHRRMTTPPQETPSRDQLQ